MSPQAVFFGQLLLGVALFGLAAAAWLSLMCVFPNIRRQPDLAHGLGAGALIVLELVAIAGGNRDYVIGTSIVIVVLLLWWNWRKESKALAKALADGDRFETSMQRFWWPAVDAPERAAGAARHAALPIAWIAFSNCFWAWKLMNGNQLDFRMMSTWLSATPAREASYYIFLAAISAYLGWRVYRNPTVLLSWIATVWILWAMALTAYVYGTQLSFFVQGAVFIALAIGGLRGAYARRNFKQVV